LRTPTFRAVVAAALVAALAAGQGGASRPASRPLSPRVAELIAGLTLEEKASQCVMDCPAVPRLGLPAYHWWNECLHGVGRAGKATVFPQAIALASMWDPELMERIGVAVGTEARAKHAHGKDSPQYGGLTFWTPTINLARDPRWGRTEETYGEDPYLTARIGVAYVRGLQGDDPRRLRVAACAKHFAVHSQEKNRERKNVEVSDADLFEWYLPAFKALVEEAGVAQVMTAYNAVNGFPCSGHPRLLKILREDWGFAGAVVSDVGAPDHIFDRHKFVGSYPEAAAWAVRGGVDVLSPNDKTMPQWLVAEVRAGRLKESALDRALAASLTVRDRLGLLRPPNGGPYEDVPASVVGCAEHVALARLAAQRSAVLLKNDPVGPARKPLLPILPDDGGIVVCGPFAERVEFGGYSGEPTVAPPTPFAALRDGAPEGVRPPTLVPWRVDRDGAAVLTEDDLRALSAARLVIACCGTGPEFEDENRDRASLDLPAAQHAFLQRVQERNPRTVLVTSSGGPLASSWAEATLPAILQTWYAGQEGPRALADLLYGRAAPTGKLPVTVPRFDDSAAPFEEYDMTKRRKALNEPRAVLWPFGHGLTYGRIDVSDVRVETSRSVRLDDGENRPPVVVRLRAAAGDDDVEETLQVYACLEIPGRENVRNPFDDRRLVGFERVRLAAGERREIAVVVPWERLKRWSKETSALEIPRRKLCFLVGRSVADIAGRAAL
jgi:beta-glucosidase